jgi:hypothetical protein
VGTLAVAAVVGSAVVRPGVAQQPATHIVVIAGLGGEPSYREAFHELALQMLDAARDRFGLPDSHLLYLAEDPARAPDRTVARSTRENVEATLGALAERAGPTDRVLILIIGHGSAREGGSAINLPGPDMTGADFAPLLAAFPTQTLAIVNTASASGGFVPALAGSRRIVVTATRSARERNETRFGGYFVRAFTDDVSDVDKDGAVSLLEAFEYARREVERSYESANQLVTEHALLEDDGDGEGSLAANALEGDGTVARRFTLAAGPAVAAGGATGAGATVAAPGDPELAALYAERARLEAEVQALRGGKDDMDPARYEAELEELLVSLALTNRAIRAREEGRP